MDLAALGLVGLGGALGASLRYLCGVGAAHIIDTSHPLAGLPVATLVVNIVGCFIIGGLAHLLATSTLETKQLWQLFLITGALGGFTTFSSFSLETLQLFSQGKTTEAFSYALLSLALCLISVACGEALARLIAK